MEKNIQLLIKKIQESNLSRLDKKLIINELNKENINFDDFIKNFINIFKVGNELLKLFDIDIGAD